MRAADEGSDGFFLPAHAMPAAKPEYYVTNMYSCINVYIYIFGLIHNVLTLYQYNHMMIHKDVLIASNIVL